MIKNQDVKKREVAPEIRALLNKTYAMLDCKQAKDAEFMRELNLPYNSSFHARNAFRQPETSQISEPVLLTQQQCEGIRQIQKLCSHITEMCQQINTINTVCRLKLEPLMFFELTMLMMQMDKEIAESKITANQMGLSVN